MHLKKSVCLATYYFSYLAGTSAWKPVINRNSLGFVTFESAVPAILRNVIFGTIFLSCTFWRLKLFIRYINIIRCVFIVCTLSVPFIVLLNSTVILMYRKVHSDMLNKLLLMISNSRRRETSDDIFERNFHIIQALLFVLVTTSLVTLDYMRISSNVSCLAVLDKINVLLLFLKLLENLTDNIKKGHIVTAVESCKQHSRLKGLIKLYGTVNRWFFLNLSIYTFVWITYNLYKFIVLHFFDFEKFPTRSFTISGVSTCLWTSLQLFHLASIIYTYHRITKADENFRSSVTGIIVKLDTSEKHRHMDIIRKIQTYFKSTPTGYHAVMLSLEPYLLLKVRKTFFCILFHGTRQN
nr:unnamed protein product [Callosobruchus chinensis]